MSCIRTLTRSVHCFTQHLGATVPEQVSGVVNLNICLDIVLTLSAVVKLYDSEPFRILDHEAHAGALVNMNDCCHGNHLGLSLRMHTFV